MIVNSINLLPLPYDRYRLSDEHRTTHGTTVSFDFGEDLSHHILTYSSSNNISLEHLALTSYYAFLIQVDEWRNRFMYWNEHR